uniref:Uncharacterized protein n=1 Tax=Zea mays TaxID=4577 RepID=A0A804LPR1_MAIZE
MAWLRLPARRRSPRSSRRPTSVAPPSPWSSLGRLQPHAHCSSPPHRAPLLAATSPWFPWRSAAHLPGARSRPPRSRTRRRTHADCGGPRDGTGRPSSLSSPRLSPCWSSFASRHQPCSALLCQEMEKKGVR